jgi:hypothetical protein
MVAGLPRALAVARAHGGDASTLGKASTGATGIGDPPGMVVLA